MIDRKYSAAALVGCLAFLAGASASDFEKDRQAILAMAGTFEVSFHFEETVSFLPDYELKPSYDENAVETIVVLEDSGGRIVLQHLLSTGRGGIIKHWRQDWEYENDVVWDFLGRNTWTKRTLSPEEVKGTWTQRVYQVDDSPRYESYGKWEHEGNLSQWTSQETNRPLPRREHTKRDDYHILAATNRHAIVPDGWVHEQDNTKVALREGSEGGGVRILAREFGLNHYRRVDDSRGEAALEWWEDRKPFWSEVRGAWADLRNRNGRLSLASEVGGESLREKIADLSREEDALAAGERTRSRIEEVIASFIVGG